MCYYMLHFMFQTRHLKDPQQENTAAICENFPECIFKSQILLPEGFQHLQQYRVCDDTKEVEQSTRDQSNSDRWFKEREQRLTASNFGLVMQRKADPSLPFLRSIFEKKNVRAPALQYGKKHESTAKEEYLREKEGAHLHECGLVIHREMPFLGASPDAVVCMDGESGIIEVKCPYTARAMTVEEACTSIPKFFLSQDPETKEIKLKENHLHYAQVQGQLLITGAYFCDFVVYTSKDLFIQRITLDANYVEKLLQKLCKFYNDYALDYLKLK